ncbi:MAG: hypothetical protein HZC42_09280 [Candidatus Eisenbacteria bacterium]|nr:hypothetical protein [Candidatus Eisenbacteria bacterium]
MTRWRQVVLVAGLLGAAGAAVAGPVSSVRLVKVEAVTFEIRHRIFPGFREQDQVKLKEDFQVGDTPYSARVVEFVPDFAMDLKSRKVLSRSNEPKNPAFRIIVREKGVPQDTTWAFLNMPPHFARKSMLAFQVLRIDFADRPPIVSGDSTKAVQP